MSPATQSPPMHTLRLAIATVGRRIRAETANDRLHGRTLVVARTAWLAVSTFTVALYVADVWIRIGQLRGPCPLPLCVHGQVPLAVQHAFADLHLSVNFYGWYGLGRDILFALGFAATAALIFWRLSHDLLALHVSLTLVVFGVGSFEGGLLVNGLPSLSPGWWLPVATLMFLGELLFATFIAIFPDGHFVPRWTRLAVVALVLLWLPNSFFPGSAFDFITWPGWAYLTMWMVMLGTMGAAQVYRYRRVSTPAQRLQTIWVVFGLVVAGAVHLAGRLVIFFLAPVLTSPTAVLADLGGYTLNYASILLIPICIGVAMLRSHLFDVDVIIRRTLVYSVLTGTLALVYFSCVFGAQAVVQTVGGPRPLPPLVLIASTLLIAALFQPLRLHLQRGIDRRFYHGKYDAARTVAAFGRALQTEVDLDRVTGLLLAAVEETIQPTHVNLWLARSTREGEPQQGNGPEAPSTHG